jgi:hypothetical protein
MAKNVPLIWHSDKAKYFLFWGLTSFLNIRIDLASGTSRQKPVVCHPLMAIVQRSIIGSIAA